MAEMQSIVQTTGDTDGISLHNFKECFVMILSFSCKNYAKKESLLMEILSLEFSIELHDNIERAFFLNARNNAVGTFVHTEL